MPSLKLIVRDRRVWLVAGLALLACVVGRWLTPPGLALQIVANAGYWIMLATFGLFLWALWRLSATWRSGGLKALRWDGVGVAVVALCGTLWFAHERQGFKVLADEVLLLGTSMGMHQVREVTYPVRATDVQGPFQLTHRVVDKRPYFFPFIVSLVHDTTGYRGTNSFYVNAVLGFVFLGLIYLIGRELGGGRWPGVLSVLLFGGLPLAAQQAAGGGFELLNLVMWCVVLLLGWRYAEQPDEPALEALCLATVLLAFTRYESVLAIIPVAAVVIWGWMRAGRVVLSWPVIVTPVLLLPYLLQNRVFDANASAWELASKPEAGAPFALHYVPDNLGHALAFFFDLSGYQPNSIWFAVLGLAALPFFFLLAVRVLREGTRAAPQQWVAVVLGLGLAAVGALFMAYFWGQFDHPVIRRLSLPVHLLMALAILVVGAKLIRKPLGWQWACGGALLALSLQGVPSMSRQGYAWEYTPGIEMAWREQFLREHPQKDYLFIDRDSVFWITQRVAATATAQAASRKEGLAYHLRNHSFSAMYVFQRFQVNDQTGALTLDPADDIGPGFVLEPVCEKRVATLHLARISRVTEIRNHETVIATDGSLELQAAPTLSVEERDKVKAAYLQRWLKELP